MHEVKRYCSVSVPSQRADLSGTLLTITPPRRGVVDFTVPIYEPSMTFLFKKTIGDGNVHTMEDLIDVPNIRFLIYPASTTWTYFENSEEPMAKRIWEKFQVSDVTMWSQWRVNEVNCGQYRKDVMGYRLRNACKINPLRVYLQEFTFAVGI